ncbi:hypothetical protein HID58_049992, partial [Brassica napus]
SHYFPKLFIKLTFEDVLNHIREKVLGSNGCYQIQEEKKILWIHLLFQIPLMLVLLLSEKKDKEHVDCCHASDMVVAHNIAILGLVESVKNLSAKIDRIDVNVADKVSEKLDATIQAKVDAKVGLYEKEIMEKIAMLVEDIKNLKEKAYSWMIEKKINSQDGYQFSVLLRRRKKQVRLWRRRVATEESEEEKAIVIPELNDISISSKDWQQHLQWEKSETIEALTSILVEPTRRRKPQLTKTQQWPFVGNSTVKRIITGVTPSTVSYDPFAKVESQKLTKVMDFIKRDLAQEESGYGEFSAKFYLKIMVPRNVWPTENYGWLCDSPCRSNAHVSQTFHAILISICLPSNCISRSVVCEIMG